jgi:arabinofuranan 3-O-arabinosyltransferase
MSGCRLLVWRALWTTACALFALVILLCHRRNEPIDLLPVWLAVDAFIDHASPYTSKRFIYPPSALVIFSPFGAISFSTARIVFLLIDAAAIAGAALLTMRALNIRMRSPAAPLLFAAAAACAPTISTLRLENVNGLILACECGFLSLALQNRWKLSGWVLGASLAIKPILFPLLAIFILLRRWDALVRALGLPLALSVCALAFSAGRDDFFTITVPFLFDGNFPELESFNVALAGAGGIIGAPKALTLACQVAVIALGVVLVAKRVSERGDPILWLVETTGIILVTTFLAFSFSFSTYALFLLPLGFSAVLAGAVARRAGALVAFALMASPDRYVLHDLGVLPVEAISMRVTVGLLLLLAVFVADSVSKRASQPAGGPLPS